MSEFDDQSTTDFFAEEAAQQSQRLEVEAYVAQFDAELLDYLDAAGAFHLWHPDQEQIDANIDSVVALMTSEKASQAMSAEEVDEAFRIRATVEMGFVARLRIASWTEQLVDPTAAAEVKKELLAELQVRKFDQGWTDVVDDLLSGDALDISKEEDFRIYVSASLRLISPEAHPIRDAIYEISSEVVSADFAEQATRLVTVMLVATKDPRKMPDAEAYIDDLVRQAVLTETHAARLRALLAD